MHMTVDTSRIPGYQHPHLPAAQRKISRSSTDEAAFQLKV